MAKGENLEKPKKGGMVIVIGVGAKPKKGDKSSMKKAERSHRNQIGSFRRKMMKDPNYLEQALSRRMKGMDKDFFEKYLKQVKGTSMEEAMQNKMYDFPQAIQEAAKAYGKFKGRYELRGETKNMLDRRGIDHSDFQQAAKERPFDDISDLLESLQPAREMRNERRPRRRYDNEERRPRSRTAQLRDMGLDEFQIQEQLEHDRLYAEDEAFKERNRRTPAPKRELDDMDVERIARLLTARYPQEVAEEMAARYVQQGFHFNPSEHEFNVSMQNRDDDEDPNVGFSAASIGAETPKSQTANPRELPPFMSPREGQGEGLMVRPFQMQTSFDNPLNVMDEAWALLKGNPSMRDADGRAINHPAAMVYDDLAAQMEAREPFAETHRDSLYSEDSETAADRMEEMRRRPQHYDFHTDISPPLDRMRREARMLTHQMMTDPDKTAGPQRGILTSESMEARREAQRERQEAEAKKRRDENTKNIRMKPGNIMDHM